MPGVRIALTGPGDLLLTHLIAIGQPDTSCPLEVYKRIKACAGPHTEDIKLCEDCGWTPSTKLPDL